MALCMCGLSYTTAFSTVQRTLSTQRLRTGYVLHMSEITDVITQSTNALQQDVSFMQADAAANLNLVGEYLRAVDFSKYWFMFPTAIGVATCAITAGIGGAGTYHATQLYIFVNHRITYISLSVFDLYTHSTLRTHFSDCVPCPRPRLPARIACSSCWYRHID